jgi:hypothetical protein
MLKYTSRTNAFDFIYNHAVKPMTVILGDDGKFWVVTVAEGERLHRQGYSYAA